MIVIPAPERALEPAPEEDPLAALEPDPEPAEELLLAEEVVVVVVVVVVGQGPSAHTQRPALHCLSRV